MARSEGVVLVDDVLAAARPTAYAFSVLALCVLVAMAEGYDAQAMALAAPLVARQWALAPESVGLLLSSSLIGMALGSFTLAPVGDRWGRRPSTLLGLLVAGGATAAGMIAPDFWTLVLTRFVAGLGLGLAMPNVLAIAMETMPARLRMPAVVFVSCGYPLGAGIGGGIAGSQIETQGYAAVFAVGGLATAAALALAVLWLPESPLFLARRAGGSHALPKLVRRLGGSFADGATGFALAEAPAPKSAVGALFAPERRTATLLLWLLMFANMAMVMFIVSWLPSLLTTQGLDPGVAVKGAAVFHGSGVVGGIVLAVLLNRIGATRVLALAYAVAIGATLGLAFMDRSGPYLAVIAIAGAMIVGSQFCMNAVVNQFYPSSIRATASGFATGAGRVGAVAAPIVGGIVIGLASSVQQGFMVAIVPAVVALLAVLALHRMMNRPAGVAVAR